VRLDLPPELLARTSIEEAITLESEEPLQYLPSRVIEAIFRERRDDAHAILSGQLASTVRVDPAEIVWVPKQGRVGRYRPITVLTPLIRVLLRGLELDLREVVRPPDRGVEAYRNFQTAVLDLPDVTHVVAADVASFYFFVDHEMLEARVVEAAARADTAATLRAVLSSLYERPLGLPQNFGPSALLSELCIAPVERKLIRRGIPAFRSNDDFRLGARTWGDALQHLEALQEEVSNVGLDLNGEKTWILKRDTYRNNLGLADKIFDAALRDNEAQDEDLPALDPYTGEPIEPEPEEGKVAPDAEDEVHQAMERVFHEALAAYRGERGERLTPFEARANRDVISTALYYFTRQASDAALDNGPRLVALDPLFALPYSHYLRALDEHDDGLRSASQVRAAIGAFRGHAPHWVQAWLFSALLRRDSLLDDDTADLAARFMLGTAPSVLRARAALVLAMHERLSMQELSSLFDESTDAARAELAVAAAILANGGQPGPQLSAVIDTSPLVRLVYEYAETRLPELAWV
jgi:hypothetical protein